MVPDAGGLVWLLVWAFAVHATPRASARHRNVPNNTRRILLPPSSWLHFFVSPWARVHHHPRDAKRSSAGKEHAVCQRRPTGVLPGCGAPTRLKRALWPDGAAAAVPRVPVRRPASAPRRCNVYIAAAGVARAA